MALKLIRHVGTIATSDLADDTAAGLALGKLGNGNAFRLSEFGWQDVFIKVTSIDQRTTVTSSNGLYLRANNTITVVPEGNRSPIVGNIIKEEMIGKSIRLKLIKLVKLRNQEAL